MEVLGRPLPKTLEILESFGFLYFQVLANILHFASFPLPPQILKSFAFRDLGSFGHFPKIHKSFGFVHFGSFGQIPCPSLDIWAKPKYLGLGPLGRPLPKKPNALGLGRPLPKNVLVGLMGPFGPHIAPLRTLGPSP